MKHPMSLREEWVRDCLVEGSSEQKREIRVLASKKGWVTRREKGLWTRTHSQDGKESHSPASSTPSGGLKTTTNNT